MFCYVTVLLCIVDEEVHNIKSINAIYSHLNFQRNNILPISGR
jgi:hypothetical protein